MSIPEHVLKNGPWSISKAGVIQKCSLQYDYKYGAQKQPELVTYFDSRLGTAVHKALEFALGGTKVKQAFIFAQDQSELTTDEVEKLWSFYDQVDKFVQRMTTFKARHGVKDHGVFLEHKIGVSKEFTSTKFFDNKALFRGVVDYALLTANNDLVIIDHKSGKQKDLKEYADQCKAYCILALALFPDLKGVQTAINFIQTDKLEWNPRVTAATIREEYQPWLVKYLIDSCEGLLSPPAAKKGWYCDWCGYKPICPVFDKKEKTPLTGVANAPGEKK